MTDIFKNPHKSHEHSLQSLELISLYDSFMDSLTVICDMGCGSGLDIEWWATLETRDDPPVPYNYVCYAVDKDISQLSPNLPKNIVPIAGDFESSQLPRHADVMYCHNAFQYAINPLNTLKIWNEQMNVNGMLVIVLPQTSNHQYNRYSSRVHSGCYFNHTVTHLLYMLAVNGFDCKDSYMLKEPNSPWINLAVYKSSIEPMNPSETSWYDLMEKGLLHDSLVASINKYGYLRQEDIILPWLDKNWYLVKD